MNIQDYGWVADQTSVVAWNNGLKWISKLIVSTQAEQDDSELRDLLDLHLREGIKNEEKNIKSVVIFYLLGWKRYDLIEEFWKLIGYKLFSELLVENLLKIYSSHRIQMIDFSKLMSKNRKKGIMVLRKFLNEKEIDPLVSKRFTEGLLSDNDAVFFNTAIELHELVDLLEINPKFIDEYQLQIEAKLVADFKVIFEEQDFSLFIHKLELIRPLSNILRYYKFDLLSGLDLTTVSLHYLSIDYLFTLAKLGYRSAVVTYLKVMKPVQADKMLLVLLLKEFKIPKSQDGLWIAFIDFIKQEDSELVFSLVSFEKLSNVDLVRIVGFLQNAINLDNEDSEIISAFNFLSLLELFGEESHNYVEGIKNKFIKEVWEKTVSNRNVSNWYATIKLLFKMLSSGSNQLLEDELLIPLLREGLLSHHSLISRFIVKEMEEKEDMAKLIDDWTEAKIYQMDLLEGLSGENSKVKMKNFFRIVNLYARLNKKELFIINKLNEFYEENDFSAVVRKKIMALINVLKGI